MTGDPVGQAVSPAAPTAPWGRPGTLWVRLPARYRPVWHPSRSTVYMAPAIFQPPSVFTR